MKHGDEKAFWLAKVMKVMKLKDKTDAPLGVGASYRAALLNPSELRGGVR